MPTRWVCREMDLAELNSFSGRHASRERGQTRNVDASLKCDCVAITSIEGLSVAVAGSVGLY